MTTKGTTTSETNPSTILDGTENPAHTLGRNLGNDIAKAYGKISNSWRSFGKACALHPDNASNSVCKQVEFMNDALMGIRETLPKAASKSLGEYMGYAMESYLTERAKLHGTSTANVPYFYQIAGSNDLARFHTEAKPVKASPKKQDGKKDDGKKDDGKKDDGKKDDGKKPSGTPDGSPATKVAAIAAIRNYIAQGIVNESDLIALAKEAAQTVVKKAG